MSNYPASQKQINFVAKLVEEKNADADLRADAFVVLDLGTEGMGANASDVISRLLKCANKPVAVNADAVTEAGFYMHDGNVYRAKFNKAGTHLYANKLVINPQGFDFCHGKVGGNVSWVYSPGIFAQLTNANRMTPEQAAEFGKLTGRCAYCGLVLEDDISRAHYMGPVCSTKYAGIKRSKSQASYAKAAEMLIARGEVPNGMPVPASKKVAV